MASTKFKFEAVGADVVLNNFKALGSAHTQFVNTYIENEQRLSRTIKDNTKNRVDSYTSLRRTIEDIEKKITEITKKTSKDSLSAANADIKTREKAHTDSLKRIEAEERKVQEAQRQNSNKLSSFGGFGTSGSFGGIAMGGVGGLAIGAITGAVSSLVSLLSSGISAAISLAVSQMQRQLQLSNSLADLVFRQPNSPGMPGHISMDAANRWTRDASSATGASQMDLIEAATVFGDAGGTIDKSTLKNMAGYFASNPGMDKNAFARGYGGISKVVPDSTEAAGVQASLFYQSHFGGEAVETVLQPALRIAAMGGAKGVGGTEAERIKDAARIIQMTSFSGKNAPGASTGEIRFMEDITNPGKGSGFKAMLKNSKRFANQKDTTGMSLFDIHELVDEQIDWTQKPTKITEQLAKLGFDKETSRFSVTEFHNAKTLAKDPKNTNLQQLMSGDAISNDKAIRDLESRQGEVQSDVFMRFQKAWQQISNTFMDAINPAMENIAASLIKNKEKITIALIMLADMFEYLSDNLPELINKAMDYIGNISGFVFPDFRAKATKEWAVSNGDSDIYKGTIFEGYNPNPQINHSDTKLLSEKAAKATEILDMMHNMAVPTMNNWLIPTPEFNNTNYGALMPPSDKHIDERKPQKLPMVVFGELIEKMTIGFNTSLKANTLNVKVINAKDFNKKTP